jgi:hypothetical protein
VAETRCTWLAPKPNRPISLPGHSSGHWRQLQGIPRPRLDLPKTSTRAGHEYHGSVMARLAELWFPNIAKEHRRTLPAGMLREIKGASPLAGRHVVCKVAN